MIIIDTSILIDVERGTLKLSDLVDPAENVAISSLTASELLHGVYRAKDATHRARRESFVEQLLANVPVLPFDTVAARVHARLWADLSSAGSAVGSHDLIIAATAIARGCPLLTRDRRSFPRIPGLDLLPRELS